MSSKKLLVGVVAAVIFIGGAGWIVYQGRPVMKLAPTSSEAPKQPAAPTATEPAPTNAMNPTASASGSYTLAEVQAHNTQTDCWSAIKGNVYDLTSWISRHPGGPAPIIGLCGTDGTEAFTNQHGSMGRPASMLALLKIGSLK